MEKRVQALLGHTPEVDSDLAQAARAQLIAEIAACGEVTSERVLEAMRSVPRHLFVPGASLEEAYRDQPLPIEGGQTISQPAVVGEMTQALELRGDERVLEIGTGSGYQAAVLSRLVRAVYTMEVIPSLGESAKIRLRELGYSNVHVRIGDGYEGWPSEAPFERIVLTAAPPAVPKALLTQLADGGILVAPVGTDREQQWVFRMRRKGHELFKERLIPVRFVPMVPKI